MTLANYLTAAAETHRKAVARTKKIAARERNLITTYALSEEIEQIEIQASASLAAGEPEASRVLWTEARRLRSLLPED